MFEHQEFVMYILINDEISVYSARISVYFALINFFIIYSISIKLTYQL